MAEVGIIENIIENRMKINGKDLNFKVSDKDITDFKKGDKVSYESNKGNIKKIKFFEEETVFTEKNELLLRVYLDYKMEKVFTENEDRLEKLCKDSFDFQFTEKKISLNQLNYLQTKLEKHKFNFNCKEIKEFVDNQIKRNISKEYYEKIKNIFFENNEKISSEFLKKEDAKNGKYVERVFNKRLFFVIKTYIRANKLLESRKKIDEGEE